MPKCPLLIGMHNPYSANPKYALYPTPERSAGARLWRMMRDVREITMTEYVRLFDRVNLVEGDKWSKEAANRHAPRVLALASGRSAVALGNDVARALGVERVPFEARAGLAGTTWYFLPHPSGLCQFWNDDANRRRAGELLWRLADGA